MNALCEHACMGAGLREGQLKSHILPKVGRFENLCWEQRKPEAGLDFVYVGR